VHWSELWPRPRLYLNIAIPVGPRTHRFAEEPYPAVGIYPCDLFVALLQHVGIKYGTIPLDQHKNQVDVMA
jgi:hypothetical protein